MNPLTSWIKLNAVILEPILALIGATKPLPDWLAFLLLLLPVVAVGMLYPVGTLIVTGLLLATFITMLLNMLRASER